MDSSLNITYALSEYPLVSVIIPVFNGEEFLPVALDSVLRQTYRSLEVIAVDDGSNDGSLRILKRYAALDKRIRVICQPNGGVASARNRAIRESSGEFIAPLDADDLWQPHKIESQVRRMLQGGDKTGIVYSWWVWIDTANMILDRSPRWNVEGRVFDSLLEINFIGNASVPLLRKTCIEEAGGYNEQMAAQNAGGCEDIELLLRIASRYEVAFVPDILLGYRRRPSSMSTAFDTMWRSHLTLLQAMRQVRPHLDSRLQRRSKHQFALYLAGLAFWSGNIFEAVRWALRSGFRLPFAVTPHVIRMLLMRKRTAPERQTMRPGVRLNPDETPEPLLPYDKIHSLRADVPVNGCS